jgi:hypothetical protein
MLNIPAENRLSSLPTGEAWIKDGEALIKPSSSARWMTLELPVETTALKCKGRVVSELARKRGKEQEPHLKCQKATASVKAHAQQKPAYPPIQGPRLGLTAEESSFRYLSSKRKM